MLETVGSHQQIIGSQVLTIETSDMKSEGAMWDGLVLMSS